MAHPQRDAVGYELVHHYPVPVRRLWRAFTEPGAFASWAWGRNAKDVAVTMDVRPGGFFSLYGDAQGEAVRGEEGCGVCGLYIEVEAGERLAYTQHWTASVGYNEGQDVVDEIVIVDFREIDGRTELRYRHHGIPDKDSAALHADAVRSTLDDLSALLEDGTL